MMRLEEKIKEIDAEYKIEEAQGNKFHYVQYLDVTRKMGISIN
jgi:hypothetical protein